jgi:hypothetical protein
MTTGKSGSITTPPATMSYRWQLERRNSVFFFVPPGYSPKFDFPLSPGSARVTPFEPALWVLEINFTTRELDWSIPFDPPQPPAER